MHKKPKKSAVTTPEKNTRKHPTPKRRNQRPQQPRQNDEKLVVAGIHPVEIALSLGKASLGREAKLWLSQNTKKSRDLEQLAKNADVRCIVVEGYDALDQLCPNTRHQGAVLVLEPYRYAELDPILARTNNPNAGSHPPFLLVLDGIEDPHNLGAILRSAAGFGVDAVIIAKDRSASVNATVLKTSAGMALKVPVVRVTNIARTLDTLRQQGYLIYGADMAGEAAETISWSQPTALVMGAEGRGLRPLTRRKCDAGIAITHDPVLESLNVSVAAAILMHLRQLKLAK